MVSVVVASYNGEKYIEKQLESIMQQTLTPDEELIFDDGSTDNTVSIVTDFIESNKLTGWRLYINEHNKGFSINFLDGIQRASGDLIFLSDQDDIWHFDKIEKMSNAMKAEGIMALCCSCATVDGDGEPVAVPSAAGKMFTSNDGTVRLFDPLDFVGRSFIRGCSVCFSSDVKAYITSIELRGLLSHDWLVTFSAALIGNCGVLNRVLMNYRCHSDNNSFGKRPKDSSALQKRIDGLVHSIDGHSYILENADSYSNMTERLKDAISKQICFEEKRIQYLSVGGLKRLMKCFFSLKRYSCYYGSFLKGIRVFLGDIAYRRKA